MKKLALGLVLVGTWFAWRGLHHDGNDAKLLYDRFWVDHEPRELREKFQALIVSGEHPIGQFATRTIWSGEWEGFHYHVVPREDGVLDIIFPNAGEQQRMKYTARRCNENGFDYCLEITGTSRGTQRYYSKKEWDRKHVQLSELFAEQTSG